LLRAGRCIAALEALSGVPDPVGLAAADALLARIDALRAEDLPVVRERAGALRALAGIAQGARFDALGLGAALKGKVTDLGGGRVRLEYAFDAEAELADFVRDDGYLLEHRKRLLAVPDDVQDEFRVKDGSLRCLGKAARRLALPFGAPLSVEYEVVLDAPKSGEPTGFFFFVGVCDDGARRFAWCSNFGDLEDWSDPREVRQALAQTERAVELGRTYTMRLAHDGERLTSFRDTVEMASIECRRTSGAVFLWLQTGMPLGMRRFAVEGRVDAAALAKLRAAWVAAQLAG
jgi:hypothetical protein